MVPINGDDAPTGPDRGTSASGPRGSAASEAGPNPVAPLAGAWPLRLRLPADTIAPSLARDQLRAWLTRLGWPPGQRDDIVLAVSEAVSNSVEHAYPTAQSAARIELHASATTVSSESGSQQGPAHGAGGRRVRVIVRDYGRWRPIPAERDNRRRGIPMMRACMDTVTIEPLTDDDRPIGTRVTLLSAPVPTR
jgi:serine/threonine-protein kinase RsbW